MIHRCGLFMLCLFISVCSAQEKSFEVVESNDCIPYSNVTLECRSINSTEGRMSIFNSKGYNVNLGCYVSFTFPRIVMLECEQPSLMRFVVVNATREEDDGEWTCRRSDLDETYSAFVAISDPFFLSDVVVFDDLRTAQVLACASEETVVEWNHSGEDGYAVNTFTGDVCGGVGMSIVTSLITKMEEGETEFMVSLKRPYCEGTPEYSPVDSATVPCTCPMRAQEITTPCPTAAATTTSSTVSEAAKTCPPIEDEPEPEASEVTCPDTTTTEAGTISSTSASEESEQQEEQGTAKKCEKGMSPATIAFTVVAVVEALVLVFLVQQNIAVGKQVAA